MRLAGLYLRSRRSGYAFAGIICVALLAHALGRAILTQPVVVVEYLAPVVIFAALLVACLVAAGAGSPFGEAEKALSFPLPALRFAHLGALLACGAALFLFVGLAWERSFVVPLLLRGLLGLSGTAFLAALVLGSRLSWMLPVGYVTLIPLVGEGSGENRWAWWAWVDQPADDPLAWTLATTLFVAGFCLACLLDVTEAPGRAR